MAVRPHLTREHVIWKLKHNGADSLTLDDLDSLAHFNCVWLQNHGWNETGIGFYHNDKYENGRFNYWIDHNAVQPTMYRYDKIEKENIEVGHHDLRVEDRYLTFMDIEDLIAWLDTAFGHEDEYCVHEKILQEEIKELPEKIWRSLREYHDLKDNTTSGEYYRMVHGCCLCDYVKKLQRWNPEYKMSSELKKIYKKYSNITLNEY